MYKIILRSLDDAAIFAVVAFLIFFIFFVALVVYAFSMKKHHVQRMADLPIESAPNSLPVNPQNKR